MKLIKTGSILILMGIVGYFSLGFYHYFFDDHKPEIEVAGIEPGGWYADDVQATLEGEDAYKIKDVSISLDGKPLINKFKINAKCCSHPFTISSKNLPSGKHTLKIEATNALRSPQTATKEIKLNIDNNPLQAAFIKQDGDHKVFQGRTLHLQFQVNKPIEEAKVSVLSKEYDAFPEGKNSLIYEAYVPIQCEELPNEYPYTVELKDKVGNVLSLDGKFQVVAFPFKRQTLHIPPEKVEEERQAGESQKLLEDKLVKLAEQSSPQKLWQGAFITPIEIQQVTTPYGTIRVTQERGRYAHKALDVINLPRSVVWATQDGIVVLKDRFEYSGNTVVIDHGHGVLSLFFHLDTFADINVGDKIKKGNPVGTLGKTGYASGYHLHWEMRVKNVCVDPMEWVKPNF